MQNRARRENAGMNPHLPGGGATRPPRPPSVRVATKPKGKAVSALLGGIQNSFVIDAKDITETQPLAAGACAYM